jgi:hypothetical protein
VSAGQQFIATATVGLPTDAPVASKVTAALNLPAGWTATTSSPASIAEITGGGSGRFTWTVTAPASLAKVNTLTATATLVQAGKTTTDTDERVVGSVPAPPPAGTDQVSDLPFLSSTNGWGPVERDQSVGGNQANDGKPLQIGSTVYAKGLGTNSVSDVQVYLAGKCSRFTATVGVDHEAGTAGTVTFSVTLDGKVLTTTGTLTGKSSAVNIDVPVTGGQVVELVVGDAGDGNGNDHGDWANPTLTCAG